MPHSLNLIFPKLVENDFRGLHLHNLKSLLIISFYTTLAQPESHYICTTWFQRLNLHNLKSFLIISFYTTFAQPESHYISTTQFQRFTSVKPEIFADDIIVHWFLLHSYNLISGFYTCTTWNLYLYGKVTYFTLHSLHTLIFITFAKHNFSGLQFLLRVHDVSLQRQNSHFYLCLNYDVVFQTVLSLFTHFV